MFYLLKIGDLISIFFIMGVYIRESKKGKYGNIKRYCNWSWCISGDSIQGFKWWFDIECERRDEILYFWDCWKVGV